MNEIGKINVDAYKSYFYFSYVLYIRFILKILQKNKSSKYRLWEEVSRE